MCGKLRKRGKGSVGGGEAGEKAKTTPDAGGKSVSEKSQATRTSKKPSEIIQSAHRILCSCSEGQTDWEEWCWKQELTTVPTLGPHGQVPDCDCQLIA